MLANQNEIAIPMAQIKWTRKTSEADTVVVVASTMVLLVFFGFWRWFWFVMVCSTFLVWNDEDDGVSQTNKLMGFWEPVWALAGTIT